MHHYRIFICWSLLYRRTMSGSWRFPRRWRQSPSFDLCPRDNIMFDLIEYLVEVISWLKHKYEVSSGFPTPGHGFSGTPIRSNHVKTLIHTVKNNFVMDMLGFTHEIRHFFIKELEGRLIEGPWQVHVMTSDRLYCFMDYLLQVMKYKLTFSFAFSKVRYS